MLPFLHSSSSQAGRLVIGIWRIDRVHADGASSVVDGPVDSWCLLTVHQLRVEDVDTRHGGCEDSGSGVVGSSHVGDHGVEPQRGPCSHGDTMFAYVGHERH